MKEARLEIIIKHLFLLFSSRLADYYAKLVYCL